MELDELKNRWDEANSQTQTINLKIIDKMTQNSYTSKMKKIVYPEMIGTIISFTGAIYLGLHFNKLNTPFSLALGIFVGLYMVLAPIISLSLLFQFNKIIDVNTPYVESLKKFTIQKIRFYKFQKYNALFSYILLGAFVILVPPLSGAKPLHSNIYFWSFTVFFGYIFLYFFSKWGLKNYNKALQQSEELLIELRS